MLDSRSGLTGSCTADRHTEAVREVDKTDRSIRPSVHITNETGATKSKIIKRHRDRQAEDRLKDRQRHRQAEDRLKDRQRHRQAEDLQEDRQTDWLTYGPTN